MTPRYSPEHNHDSCQKKNCNVKSKLMVKVGECKFHEQNRNKKLLKQCNIFQRGCIHKLCLINLVANPDEFVLNAATA